MELPIKLELFKKLELYQGIKFQDKKNKTQPALFNAWNTEKEILSWTVLNLHHSGDIITEDFARNKILKIGTHMIVAEAAAKYDIHMTNSFNNLIQRIPRYSASGSLISPKS